MKGLAVAVIVLVLALAALVAARNDPIPDQDRAKASKTLPPDSVLSVRPRAAAVTSRPSSKLSPEFREMIASPTYGPLFERLRSMPNRTAEQQWMYARMLYRCGRVDFDMPSNRDYKSPSRESERARFIASLSVDDPDYGKRIASYDAMWQPRANRCDAVSDEPLISRDRWRSLLEASAAGGNPRARIDLIEDDLQEKYRVQSRTRDYSASPTRLTPEQIDGMKLAVASADPYALESAIRLMSYPYENFSLRDAHGQTINTDALSEAGELIACEYGYPCDHSPRMDQACALMGRCAAASLRDYILYYNASPYESQLIAQYEHALREVGARNDWSGFRFVAGPVSFPGTIR